MQYIPEFDRKEIEENHKRFSQRVLLYKKRGLDFLASRESILAKVAPLENNILEIGTGSGYTTLCLAKAGYKFISVDKDKESLKIAALNLAYPVRNKVSNGTYENLLSRVNFYAMDGSSLAFADNPFRTAVAIGLFHHITDVKRLCSEIDRVLSRDGKIILADFNKNGMEIIDSVHKEEGNIHEDSGANKDYAYSYFHALGYDIKTYEDNCHWVLIGKKKILQ